MVLSCAAASAAFGIFQYGILHYDQLGQRPRGTLGHYMTYSGLLMLVIGVALARMLFGQSDRMWAALVMPALGVAVALTFTRSTAVGDLRGGGAAVLAQGLPAARGAADRRRAVHCGRARPDREALRLDVQPERSDGPRPGGDAERRADDCAHPLMGVGPNMVERLYPQYRGPDAVKPINPHLHNVPLQIAAERGLPALAIWLWFVVALVRDLWQRFSGGRHRELGGRRARGDRRHARRGIVRVQLRRLRIPDAVSADRDAAVAAADRSAAA